MPAVAEEKYNGRSGEFRSEGNRYDTVWIVRDATDEADAVGTAYTTAPSTQTTDDGKTLYRGAATWEEINCDTGIYEVTIKYVPREQQQAAVDTVRIRVSVGGATQKITQSLATSNKYPAGSAPDLKQAIGVTADEVEGVEIQAGSFKFTVSKVFDLGDLPDLSDIYNLSAYAPVNDDTVTFTDSFSAVSITLAEGECLFLGAELGEVRSDGAVEVVYSFEASPSVVNITIGTITGINAEGWEYIWVMYEPDTAGTGANKVLAQKPKFVYVEKVYEKGDFTVLGL